MKKNMTALAGLLALASGAPAPASAEPRGEAFAMGYVYAANRACLVAEPGDITLPTSWKNAADKAQFMTAMGIVEGFVADDGKLARLCRLLSRLIDDVIRRPGASQLLVESMNDLGERDDAQERKVP